MTNTIQFFTDLTVWQKGHQLVLSIYKITLNFPRAETFGLTSQLRRASVSITSNIAEGFSRKSFAEKIQFLYLAKGSLTEVQNQLMISRDVGYITAEKCTFLLEETNVIGKMLSSLIEKTQLNKR